MSKNRLACYLPEYSWKRNFREAQLWNWVLHTRPVREKNYRVPSAESQRIQALIQKNGTQVHNQLAWRAQGVSLGIPELHNTVEGLQRGSPTSTRPRSSAHPHLSASPSNSSKSCAMSRLVLTQGWMGSRVRDPHRHSSRAFCPKTLPVQRQLSYLCNVLRCVVDTYRKPPDLHRIAHVLLLATSVLSL